MCHLLLLLPVLALPVFWFWPFGEALPVYVVAVGLSVGFYLLIWKVWKMPPENGTQKLIGVTGSVVRVDARTVTLRLGGELWTADVQDGPLAQGQHVVVVRVDGLRLTARPVEENRTSSSAD